MPSSIPSPARRVAIEPLTHTSFATFGSVIENPAASSLSPRSDLHAVTANQGTAQRWFDVARLTNFYSLSPSKKPGSPSISLARCAPRKLRKLEPNLAIRRLPNAGPNVGASFSQMHQMVYDINVLERHPFTSQTFIPLGLPPEDTSTRYLVIVAPTLPVSRSRKDLRERPKPYPTPEPRPKRSLLDIFSRARPSPFTNETSPPTPDVPGHSEEKPKGAGMPDLDNIRVFLATGSQGITYSAGTWHAPMVVIGQRPVDFVIVQNMNGVALEDCQEVELKGGPEGGLTAVLDMAPSIADSVRAKL